MTKNENKGYIFNYHLTPEKTGTLLIPPVEIRSGSDTVKTNPLVIVARKPAETDDFKLRLSLSKDTCYVGEPVTLTVTWYLGKDVRDFSFNLPILHDKRFNFADTRIDRGSGKKLFRIPLSGSEVIGEQGSGVIDGTRYTTITFSKVLMPLVPGTIPIEQATLTCSAISGYSKRSDDPFSGFFDDDFFGSSRRAVYNTVVVPSNNLTLNVSELPTEGRPSDFRGHIGNYRIESNASPLEVSVGDPVTLNVKISGPEYLEYVELPPLKNHPEFKNRFKIPDERAGAEITGNSKQFTQTIRPLNADVKEIPPVELPYFDTDRGEYRIAKSEPIPLSVKQTKIVTVLDAEGTSGIPSAGSDIESLGKGIAYNYQDMDVLEKQCLTPLSCLMAGPWFYMAAAPPALLIILFTGVAFYRKRNNDPMKSLTRKAFGRLRKCLKEAEKASAGRTCELVLDALKEYLAVRLHMPSGGAVTFADAEQRLESMGIDEVILEKLKNAFESCEAGRYAGNITFKDNSTLISGVTEVASQLEKRLR